MFCVYYTVDYLNSEKLRDTICKRIGVEQFEDKLEHISQSEAYTKALQRPIFSYTSSIQLLYDYEFARIFKLNESKFCFFNYLKVIFTF